MKEINKRNDETDNQYISRLYKYKTELNLTNKELARLINSKLGCIVTTQIVDGNNIRCIIYNIGDDLDLNTYKITFIGYSTTKPSV